MEVILLQSIDKLGEVNDIVKVKAGYGRNFLIPKGMAKIANATNVKIVEENRRQQQHKAAKIIKEARDAAEKLQKIIVKVGAKVGQNDKIFGSVTTLQLSDAISNQAGVEIDRKRITIIDDVKTTGTFKAKAELHREVVEEFSFEVIAED
jgi:large subunit ribosomal protein L9